MRYIIIFLWVTLVLLSVDVLAAQQVLPSYANTGGSLTSQSATLGKKITDVVVLVVGIISVLAIIWSGFHFATANGESGRRFFFGGMIGIIIASLAFSLAKLAVV